jgi:predicted permease
MTWLEQLRRRARILFRKNDVESELADEVRLHVAMEADELERQGWDRRGARREAQRRLGGVEPTKEGCRQTRPLRWMDDLIHDTLYGLRQLRRRPGFTVAVVLSLALGIGANTAIFSLLDAVMWRMLPVDRPEELWTVGEQFTHQAFRVLTEDDAVLAGAAAYARARLNVSIDGSVEPTAEGQLVSGGYFALLGVAPIAGRAIGPEDDRVPNAHPVAMLSDGYWARRFGRAPSTIGRVISISGTPFTVVGVAPPEFFGVEVGTAPDLYVPIMMQPTAMRSTSFDLVSNSLLATISPWLRVLARVQPGVSPEQATAALAPSIRASFLSQFGGRLPATRPNAPETAKLAGVTASILEDLRPELTSAASGFSDLRQEFSRPLFILMTVVGVLLLIACANTANLLLARATARRRELATRLALGAGRWRLMRQLLVESVLLAALGGGAGLLLAGWASEFLVVFMSLGRTPIVMDLRPDVRVLTFAVSVSMLTGVVFGIIPAVRASGINVTPTLKGMAGVTGLAGGRQGHGPDRLLAVCQIALSLVLLIGAGLFVRSLAALNDRDAGFGRESVLIVRVEPQGSDRGSTIENSERLDQVYQNLVSRVEALPGVRSASLAQFTPTNPEGRFQRVTTPAGAEIMLHYPMVYPGYFATMGVPFLAGRDFDARDLARNATGVAVVNETFARQVWPGESAVGKPCQLQMADMVIVTAIGTSGSTQTPSRYCEIVGVVQDSPYADFTGEIVATRYQPFLQTETGGRQMALHARVAGDPTSMIPGIRSEVARVDPTVPMFDVRTLADEVDAVLIQQRLVATLTSVFGTLALLLACVGLYGLLAFAVVRRTSEIGVRMALGAGRRALVWMVMREALLLVLAGGAMGLAVGLGVARVAGSQISGLLFGIETIDPRTFVGAALVLAASALLAAYLPARRASRVNPVVALRAD